MHAKEKEKVAVSGMGLCIIKCELLFGAGNLLNAHGFGSFNTLLSLKGMCKLYRQVSAEVEILHKIDLVFKWTLCCTKELKSYFSTFYFTGRRV